MVPSPNLSAVRPPAAPRAGSVAGALTDRACQRVATALVLLSVLFHLAYLAFNCPLDLAPDEAHYWQWSRHLDWSYYSKGPLVAWLIRASCELFGPLSESLVGSPMLAVRLPAVACHALLLWGWYVLAALTLRSHRAALATVALALTLPPVLAGAVLMTIDPPFMACWVWAAVWVWKGLAVSPSAPLPPSLKGRGEGEPSRAESDSDAREVSPTPPGPPSLKGRGESRSLALAGPNESAISDSASVSEQHSPLPFREGGRGGVGLPWWLLAAVCSTLGVLAKYPMVLLPCGVFGYLLFTRRAELKRPGFWLFALGSAAGFVPVLIWNAGNDWVSFKHVGTQAVGTQGSGVRWFGPLTFAAGQAAFLMGVWFVVWSGAAWTYRRTADPALGFLWWASVPVWAVFAVASFKASGQLNWPAAAYITGFVLGIAWVRELLDGPYRKYAVRTVAGGAAVGLAVALLVHFPGLMRPALVALAGEPTDKKPTPIRQFDPTARLRGWQTLAQEVDVIRDRVRAETGEEPLVAGTVWNVPGQLGVYCKGNPETYSFGLAMGDRHSQYDLWRPNPVADAQAFRGRTFVFVGDGLPADTEVFERIEQPTIVVHREGGAPVAVWWVWVGHGFRGFPKAASGPTNPRY